MRCGECGAELPGAEICLDRFHTLLAAEQDHPEAAAMHGLFVFTYYAQHPSLCKPWVRAWQADALRAVFGEGRAWQEVLAWPTERVRRQAAVDRAKARYAGDGGTVAVGLPIRGEATVAELPVPGSLQYPAAYPAAVEAWARSVAEHRCL